MDNRSFIQGYKYRINTYNNIGEYLEIALFHKHINLLTQQI